MQVADLDVLSAVSLAGTDALLVIDVQNDFIPGGALAVEQGYEIVPAINEVATKFRQAGGVVVLTQDWHPPDHQSFASTHPGKEPGDTYEAEGIGPVLWPDHCVQGSMGARFVKDLDATLGHAIIRKGLDPAVDSYSAFRDQNKTRETGLRGYLASLGVKRVFTCGLALDYCVYFSTVDAVEFEFGAVLLVDLTRGIDQPEGNLSRALEDMVAKGVEFARGSAVQLPE